MKTPKNPLKPLKTMKATLLPSYEICNDKGRDMVVDLLQVEATDGARKCFFFKPGTVEELDEIPTQIDEFQFTNEEILRWGKDFDENQRREERFISAVRELVIADKMRSDTSIPAQSVREYLTGVLQQSDPLFSCPE